MKREHNRNRLEIRCLECREVTPRQVGFVGARLAGRLETRIRRAGKWCQDVIFLLSSLTIEQLQARGMLSFKRGYWVIESRLHHCLDITMQEDMSRVRTLKAARILGTVRRIVLSLANTAVNRARKKNSKTKSNTRSFQQRFRSARGGRQRLHALIFAKSPAILDLQS